MATKTITIDLNKDLGLQLKAIDNLKTWIQEKTDLMLEKLKDKGVEAARVNFANATYDMLTDGTALNNHDISVSFDKIKNGYAITASGEDVCFVEFGAGVSQAGTYPIGKPAGIDGIGEFGDGRGSQEKWVFNDGGEKRWTTGTPTNASLYQASKEMEQNILSIAREVFK